jgi:hypothetical protein
LQDSGSAHSIQTLQNRRENPFRGRFEDDDEGSYFLEIENGLSFLELGEFRSDLPHGF